MIPPVWAALPQARAFVRAQQASARARDALRVARDAAQAALHTTTVAVPDAYALHTLAVTDATTHAWGAALERDRCAAALLLVCVDRCVQRPHGRVLCMDGRACVWPQDNGRAADLRQVLAVCMPRGYVRADAVGVYYRTS